MDLGTYLLNRVIDATTPPNESEAALRLRRDATYEMIRAYAPTDNMEGMLACHCVTLQIHCDNAMRDANDPALTPAQLARARAQATSSSRTLLQWVKQYESTRKRNEARAAEARAELQKAATSPEPEPAEAGEAQADAPVTPPPPPDPWLEEEPMLRVSVPNGRTGADMQADDPLTTPDVLHINRPIATAASRGSSPSETNGSQTKTPVRAHSGAAGDRKLTL
jgi:hypothetical protein